MRIKYVHIKEIEWCCNKMKYQQEQHKIWIIQNGEIWLDLHNENREWVHEKLNYCPFCGKKIEFI